MQTALTLPTRPSLPRPIAAPLVQPPEPAATKAVPLLLFGRDANGRAHAAHFVGHQAGAVERAADLADLYCVAAETDDLRELSASLAAGRLFPASGKALVPFCSGKIYEQLLAAAGIVDAPTPVKAASKPADGGGGTRTSDGRGAGGSGAGDPPAKPAGAKAAGDWARLKINDVVLAEDEDEGGFYTAKVVATKADDAVQLVWTGYPDLPEFSRARRSLGLLHPDAVEAAE